MLPTQSSSPRSKAVQQRECDRLHTGKRLVSQLIVEGSGYCLMFARCFPVAAWGPKKHHSLCLGNVDGKMRAVQGWFCLFCAT